MRHQKTDLSKQSWLSLELARWRWQVVYPVGKLKGNGFLQNYPKKHSELASVLSGEKWKWWTESSKGTETEWRASLLCVTSVTSDSATLWTVARQAPQSLGSSRQEYWSGFPCPPPGDLPDPEFEPTSATLQVDSLLCEPTGELPLFISFTLTLNHILSLLVTLYLAFLLCVQKDYEFLDSTIIHCGDLINTTWMNSCLGIM